MSNFQLLLRTIAASLLLSVFQFAAAESIAGLDRIEVYPREFHLRGPRDRVQFVVSGYQSDDAVVELTRDAIYEVEQSRVLKVSKSGIATPLADGTTSVTVKAGGQSQTVQVRVSGQLLTSPVSFDHQVLPILTKAGCSGGSCHGSPHGKAGFRLSLFAFDPALDRLSVVREEFGRRANPIDPAQSLLLLKPTMQLAHQGGKRLSKDDTLYTLLHDWIGEGCRVKTNDVKCVGIRVFPSEDRVLHHPSWTQQMSVHARFSDGSVRDVTHLSKFETSDESVASVTADALVVGSKRGEVAVIARYLEHVQTPLLTFVRDVDGFTWNDPPKKNYIDERVDEKLQQLQFTASQLCSDEVFVRRVYLDSIGLLPTPEETDRFLNDSSHDRRKELIDELLQRPEFSLFWAQKWGDLLRISRKQIGLSSVYKYNRWLQHAFATNLPYDQFARELLTASGSTLTNPAGNYYRTAGDTNDAMETTAQLFLGSRIQCAKCHNHPFERWTTNNYYGMAAFFNRIERKKTIHPEEVFLWSKSDGEVTHPHSGQAMKPWVPSEGEIEVAGIDRRRALVDWLTSKENPFFAKVEVNRIWAGVMGRGIVEPFDDFRDSNPPSNGPLLDALADDFVQHRFDRKHILRTILNSRTYQASSQPNEFNRDDYKYFSHYTPRRLSAEQLVDALGQVTGRPKQFELVATGTKATWLPAPDLKPHDRSKLGDIEFLKVFGQPERQSVCECDRGDDTSLGQALQLFNGEFIHNMLTDEQNRFHQAIKAGTANDKIITDLYLRAISRRPTPQELDASLSYLSTAEDKKMAIEDICWAIINKNEFLFQH